MEDLIRFAVYGIVGLMVETVFRTLTRTFSNRQFTPSLPPIVMFPIYGVAVFLFEPVHYALVDHEYTLTQRLLVYVPGLYLVELVAGTFILLTTGRYPWYYDGRWHYQHLINFSYAPLWTFFLVGLEQLHDTMDLISSVRFISM